MKITCNIIRDILPMYEEELVSNDTKALVEEHLPRCQECRDFYDKMLRSAALMEEIKAEAVKQGEDIEIAQENRAVKRSFRKIKKRWAVSLLCIALLVPVVGFCGRVTANQIQGQGLRFTNMVDMYQCKSFFQKIKNQDFTGMYDMLNVEEELLFLQGWYEAAVTTESFMNSQEIKLDNHSWILSEHYEGDYEVYESEDEFWEDAINHPARENVVLIPEKIWDEYVPSPLVKHFTWNEEKTAYYYPSREWINSNLKVDGGEDITVDEKGDFTPHYKKNIGFVYCKTKWGNFYAYGCSIVYYLFHEKEKDEGTLDSVLLLDGNLDSCAMELALYTKVMPEELYHDAQKEYQMQKQETIHEIEEEYGDVLDMTVEEFRNFKKKDYENMFHKYFQKGYSITKISYDDEDQQKDDTMFIRIEAQDADGNKDKGTFQLLVEDGKISISSCGIELKSENTTFVRPSEDNPVSLLHFMCTGDYDSFCSAVG